MIGDDEEFGDETEEQLAVFGDAGEDFPSLFAGLRLEVDEGTTIGPAPRTTHVVLAENHMCIDHWHCDPALAAHQCTSSRPRGARAGTPYTPIDRTKRCPTCGAKPLGGD